MFGMNCIAISNVRVAQCSVCMLNTTHPMRRKRRRQVIGEQRNWRCRGKRRSLRRALLLGAIVGRGHGGGYISAWCFYVGA